MISTRGRYALRTMIDLAEHGGEGYIPMKEVAERQCISLKYIEKIMPILKNEGLVEGIHGKGGGYRLTKPPQEYIIGDILRLTEGDLAPVACLAAGTEPCPRNTTCRTVKMWRELNVLINDFFDNLTILDLMQ